MTSSFAWLDFSDSDRRTALDVIDLFREKGTVDELGLGTVRDAIANLLFPGTSTIMTRVRYYLFIPWIYRRHEDRKTPSNEMGQRARQDEIRLIDALVAGGETKGVIGIESRATLKRLPSAIYWQGLEKLGIRKFSGSIDSYHRGIDGAHRRASQTLRGDDNEVVTGGAIMHWDPYLPKAPADLLRTTTLSLSRVEARYLRDRIIDVSPRSLLAFFVDREAGAASAPFPWEHPLFSELPPQLREQVVHAREFSQIMHGAALLYNLMLADKAQNDELQTGYQDWLGDWADGITQREAELARWDRAAFWRMVEETDARVPGSTRQFVDTWIDLALRGDPARLARLPAARTLIATRERTLKGGLARLENIRALNLWQGASFTEAMDYRWSRPIRDILEDIRAGLVR